MAALRTAIDTHQATAPPVVNLGTDFVRPFSDTGPKAVYRTTCPKQFIRLLAFPTAAFSLFSGNRPESESTETRYRKGAT